MTLAPVVQIEAEIGQRQQARVRHTCDFRDFMREALIGF